MSDLVIHRTNLPEFRLDAEHLDHLIGAIENYSKENSRLPREIIMNQEFGRYYFQMYKQGVPVTVIYKNKQISITVNERFKASELFIR